MATSRSASSRVDLEGTRELERLLADLPVQLRKKALNAAVKKGASIIAKDARRRAPVGRGVLKKSITSRKIRREVGAQMVGPLERAFYGRFLEQGTKFMSARPWLEPAFDAQKTAAAAAIRNSLAPEVTKLARKLREKHATRKRR